MTASDAEKTQDSRVAQIEALPDSEAWHALEADAIARALGVAGDGLAADEAARRLAADGPNELEDVPPPNALAIFASQFRSPLIFILVVAAVVTALLDEWIDTGVITAVLILNALIGFAQERKAEQSVRALQSLVSPKARVVRGGHEHQIPSRELVRGDVVLLESGVRVPADLRLLEVNVLDIDESLLTGESLPVTKKTAALPERTSLADRLNMAFAGSMVTTGRGRGVVVATGVASQLGEIAEQMRSEESPRSPLQIRMTQLARIIGIIVGAASAATFLIGIALGQPAGEMFRFAVAMAVSAIPEGLPIVLTITLAVGVRRMAQRNVVVRRLAAVETLGSTTLIGSDKTGTLTENRMTVMSVYSGGHRWQPDSEDTAVAEAARNDQDPLHRTLVAGVLANEADAHVEEDDLGTDGDPTEVALLVAAWRLGLDPTQLRADHETAARVPFESERRYSAVFVVGKGRRFVCVKGAPEKIADLCDRQLGPNGPEPLDADAVHRAEEDMAAAGLRVLAMAENEVDGDWPVDEPDRVVEAGGLVFLGLQGMLDPPRAGVAEAVAGCRRAGIRTLMITGDHALTAQAIAARLGIGAEDDPVLTGLDIEDLTEEELESAVRSTSVFARVSPEHKLRIVTAARRTGDTVAVTGDGVNDAPALKAADIGVAMGRGGTDVAREASDMVLTDDNFTSIYAAVHEGRVTFDNVRKVTFFLLSTGAGSIIALLTALIVGWPLLMLPTQLLWLNLVTNGVQDVAMAFEPAEKDVLERPPRRSNEGVMSGLLWRRTVLVGMVMATGTLLTFRWTLDETGDLDAARTVALTTMVLFQAFHLGNARSERVSVLRMNPFSNRFLFVAAATALSIHSAALYLAPTQFLLHVVPLDLTQWAVCLVAASTIIVAVEIHKLVPRLARR